MNYQTSNIPHQNNELYEDEIDLKNLWDGLVRQYKTIIIVTLCVFTLSIIYTFFIATPVYLSKASLGLSPPLTYTLKTEGVVKDKTGQIERTSYLKAQLQFIKSPTMAKLILSNLGIKDSFIKKFKTEQAAIESFIKKIKVAAVKNSNIANIDIQNQDPYLAQKINQEISNIIQELNQKATQNNLRDFEAALQAQKAGFSSSDELKGKELQELGILEIYLNQVSNLIKQNRNSLSIISPPSFPEKTIKPKIKLNLMLGLISGLFLGVMLALLKDFLKKEIKTLDEAKQLLKLPYLSTTDTHNILRSVRTNLLVHSSATKSLCISSSDSKTDTTQFSYQLAQAFTHTKQRVLLIDANLSNGQLHQIASVNNETGLLELLASDAPITSYIQSTHVENLSILTCGQDLEAIDLLSTSRFQDVLSSEAFDSILITTPPLNQSSDALIPAHYADATLIVASIGITEKESLLQAQQQLQQAQANLVGFSIPA